VPGLTEEERYAVADHAVAQLKKRGDPWRLNEEAPLVADCNWLEAMTPILLRASFKVLEVGVIVVFLALCVRFLHPFL
jgi:hypothetical protein